MKNAPRDRISPLPLVGAVGFLGVFEVPPGGSISITASSGAAIFYGATVDNTTGDPSLQTARGAGIYEFLRGSVSRSEEAISKLRGSRLIEMPAKP